MAAIPIIGQAVGMGLSAAGAAQKDKKKELPGAKLKETPWAPGMRNFLSELMNRDLDYPRQRFAPMSSIEKEGLASLSDIMEGKSFRDPRTSPYYQGIREEAVANTERGASALRHRQNMGGMFRSSPGVRQEGEYRSAENAKLLQALGSLYEAESARDNPYTRLNAAMTYGSLPRQIEQATLNAEYNDLMQELLAPYTLQAPLAESMMNYAPWQQRSFYLDPDKAGLVLRSLGSGLTGMFSMPGFGNQQNQQNTNTNAK